MNPSSNGYLRTAQQVKRTPPLTADPRNFSNIRRHDIMSSSTPSNPRSYAEESSSISSLVQDHHVVVIRQAEEIRRLRRNLLDVTNERDFLLCEVHHLKMEILANELGRIGDSLTTSTQSNFSVVVEEDEENDGKVNQNFEFDGSDTSHVIIGTCVDDEVEQVQGNSQALNSTSIYSSSEMTRLSSSSSSSSASSSPVIFTTSSKSTSTQFHDSSEETGETGVVERRYGGPPARDAALVIQRAFRRYSMVKEFQRIKTERRLSRRITSTTVPTQLQQSQGTQNGYSICGELEGETGEICVGDEEEDDSIHSGELSRSPLPEHHVPNGHHQWQLPSSHSSPDMTLRNHVAQKSLPHQPNSDTTLSNNNSSRLPPHPYGVPIQHLHAYTQQQYNSQNTPNQQQYFNNQQFINGKQNQQIKNNSPNHYNCNVSKPEEIQQQPRPILSEGESEILRKRLYRVGLNLFNKKPEVGISYLVKKKFLEGSSSSVARFLITRKGLSKQMIGEYLANLQSPFCIACLEHFANDIDLSSLPIDLALRRFQSFLRMPGEAQKIERIMETFSRRYAACNPHVISQFRNGADTVFVLAFAIVMLNTDLHTPHLRQDRRMKMEDFIKNLRGIDDGGDIEREMLVSIYERIKQTEFRTGSDHVTQVMKVQQTIVGKKPNLALPHRRLVCYCRLYEVADLNKKEKSGSHQREVFLFNDVLVLTKIFHKKRNTVTYSFRQSYPLAGISLLIFTNQYYDYGMCLKRGDTVLLNLNARNEHDRAKFAEDLREAIAESDEMVRIESISKENRDRDSGVDVGKIKRFSNSLLDIHDQCKPVRRGSCGSLDSGMSISFHSDELQQHQLTQNQSSVSSQSSSLTTTNNHPTQIQSHSHQGSSCSSSSNNSK